MQLYNVAYEQYFFSLEKVPGWLNSFQSATKSENQLRTPPAPLTRKKHVEITCFILPKTGLLNSPDDVRQKALLIKLCSSCQNSYQYKADRDFLP